MTGLSTNISLKLWSPAPATLGSRASQFEAWKFGSESTLAECIVASQKKHKIGPKDAEKFFNDV